MTEAVTFADTLSMIKSPELIGFILIYAIFYYFSASSIIFSKAKGHFYKGRNLNKIKAYFQKTETSEDNIYEEQIPLDQIYAIQLIAVRNTEQKETIKFYDCELNLVLSSKERVNVIYSKNHGSEYRLKKKIRTDAEELSCFLSVPVWDAIDYKNI